MKIKNLKEWFLKKEGQVSGAYNRPATIGELMTVAEIIIQKEESEKTPE